VDLLLHIPVFDADVVLVGEALVTGDPESLIKDFISA
jgi:hypothetical protein